jgi:hypothetical protein
MNPNFFKGTILEHQAEKVLAELRANGSGRERPIAAARG